MIKPKFDLDLVRKQFPMLSKKVHGKDLIYFDSAATAQKPQRVIDTLTDFYTNHYATVHRAVYELAQYSTTTYSETRNTAAKFLGISNPNEIIFTRGTTSSLNLIAQTAGSTLVKAGDEVVISAMEHHANIVPWQILCNKNSATLKVIPFNKEGVLDLDVAENIITEKTKIVSICHVSNTLGTVNPIAELSKIAKAKGALVVVDGAQAAPHLSLNIPSLGCDFYAFSGHKICGPTGVGVLWGRYDILETLPPWEGGGDMIDQVTFEKTTYQMPPMRFEAGTPMIAQVIGLKSSMEFLMELGLSNIHDYESRLYSYLEKQLSQISGLKILGEAPGKEALATFSIKGIHPLDLATLLDFSGVAIRTGHHCAQPVMRYYGIETAARASLMFYNSSDEIDRFIEFLKKAISTIRD